MTVQDESVVRADPEPDGSDYGPKPNVNQWKGRVRAAFDYWGRRLDSTEDVVTCYCAQDRGRNRLAGDTAEEDDPVANKPWEYVQSVTPQVLYKEPAAFLTALRPGRIRRVEKVQKLLNNEIRRIPFVKHGKKVVADALMRGWGISKVGYVEAAAAAMFTPSGLDQPPGTTPLGQRKERFTGRVTFRHVPARDFAWDPDAPDLEDARWCVHRTRESVEEIKANPLYENTDDLDLRDDFELSRGSEDGLDPTDDSARQADLPNDQRYVTVYEVWIRSVGGHSRMLLVLAEGCDKPLRWEPVPYEKLDWPFRMLSFTPDPKGEVPGLSDVAPWMGLSQHLNELLLRVVEHVEQLKSIVFYDENLEDSIQSQIKNAGRGTTFIPCNMTGVSDGARLDQKVVPMNHPKLPQEFWTAWSTLEALIRQVSGYTPFNDATAKVAGTASEANILDRMASLRIDDRLSNGTAVWAQDVLQDLLEIICDFYEEGAVPDIAPDAAGEFIEFTRDDLDIDARVRIDFGTLGRVTSDEQKKKELVILISQLAPFLQSPQGLAGPLRELVRRLLVAHHIEDADALLPVQTPPILPAQEDLEMMISGQPALPSPLDDHRFHRMQHQRTIQLLIMQGKENLAQVVQAHDFMHQRLEMAGPGPMVPQGGPGSPPSPGAANPDGFGSPVATPTSPDQTMGINLPGGMG